MITSSHTLPNITLLPRQEPLGSVNKKDRERDLVKNSIESTAKLLRQLIKVSVNQFSDMSHIKKCNDDIKKVSSYIKSCQDLLMKYINYDNIDNEYCCTINTLLNSANEWIITVEKVYSTSEAHAVSSLKGDSSSIGIFSSNAEMTVYEFIEQIDIAMTGWGTSKQKANQLYTKHLSEDLKTKTVKISQDFSGLKKWLIEEYGSPDTIISDILAGLSAKRKPTIGNRKERYIFFSEVCVGIARLDKLARVPNIDIDDLDTILYSRSTLRSLFKILPVHDLEQFKRIMLIKDLDWKNPLGIRSFSTFKKFCENERGIVEDYKNIDGPEGNPKHKTVFRIDQDHDSGSEDEGGVHVVGPSPPKYWYAPGGIFPCPISGHTHEMHQCKEFFSLHPHKRWDAVGKNKICFCCLRPRNVCNDKKKCMFMSSVPDELICQGCATIASQKGWSPLNILLCKKSRHAPTRAPYQEIKRTFEKYMGKFSADIEDKNIRYAVNFAQQVYSVTPCKTPGGCTCCEKPTGIDLNTPTIDSKTGDRIALPPSEIKTEIKEHSAYLMQTIRIGRSKCLVFFDRGANTNLIKGELATKENLQRISMKPANLTVVGGSTVKTEYGVYRFALGPTESGDYHEIRCQGIDRITSDFKKYRTDEIVKEFKQYANPTLTSDPVPPYIAGTEVHLLLGIKNTHLDPTLITILPSGVGVYKSPFVDIHGSRIIFAGPHSSFTRTNGNIRNDISHAIFHARELEIPKPWLDKEIHYSVRIDRKFNILIHPTPITEVDVTEGGGEVLPELSETYEDNIEEEQDQNEAHFCGLVRTVIPIAKMRELINEDNNDQLVTYRCSKCAECITCKRSPRLTAISLQEAAEQDLIEKSIKIDFDNKKVIATLPFTKDPVQFLSTKHKGKSNMRQAKSIYFSQCRKPDVDKQGMIKAHKELVDRGFMIKLTELPSEVQGKIKTAEFSHYYPWFIVRKEDSLSTPIRLVVDPSCTGMNQILPKGENRLGNIIDLMVRNRVVSHVWSSDISKLYNQLHLDPSAYPYSQFLFHESMDENVQPEVYIMVRAWYGVICTGNQSGYALDRLAEIGKDEFPHAKEPLSRNRYVDDIFSGSETAQGRELQISQVSALLEKAGFNLKFVVRSGEKPDEKASSDGKYMKLLGYKWDTEQDVIHPGVSELNLNRKTKGNIKPNDKPVISEEDADEILESKQLTRRLVISKISEIYDPLGLWEPLKLQLKLLSAGLGSRPWDEKLNQNEQEFWKNILRRFVRFGELSALRFTLGDNLENQASLRLVCMSDAGQGAGGAVIYVGSRTQTSTWTSSLLCSKSRLMKGTVPRNELSAILLMAELAYIVKRSLGNKVREVIYLTDSTIALSWIHNTNIKVRAYIFTRVQTIRRLIQMTTENEIIPVFHIDGKINIADLLTKPHDIQVENISIGSDWQQGPSWLTTDSSKFPYSKYEDLTVSDRQELDIKSECFSEPFLPEPERWGVHSIDMDTNPGKFDRSMAELIIDPIAVGWLKTIRILNIVVRFPHILSHKTFHSLKSVVDCLFCSNVNQLDLVDFNKKAKNVLFRYETQVALKNLTKKQLKKFTLKDGILYFFGRLSKDNPFRFADISKIPFMDTDSFSGPIPIMLVDSPILYSLIMYIHCIKLPHAGVEITVKEVSKEVMVHGGLRRLVRKIKENCTTCRILERKSVEISMSEHPAARTLIAPPFFQMMIDIAYGFKGRVYKRARVNIKVYALVGVCLLTGATSILALEGLECQDIVGALERHASRHGVPSDIYVDQGTQLLAMKHAKFSIRDIDSQVHDSMGIRVHESNAKAHSERGRVERKIRTIRSLLERTGVQTSNPMTCLQWETVFCKIASSIDDLPMAKGDTSNVNNLGFEILTANRLKLGRNNARALERGGFDLNASKIPTNVLETNRQIYETWYQLFCDNIHMLMLKPDKWSTNSRMPLIDDVVLFVFNDAGYSKQSTIWKLGRISKCFERKVEILYISKISKTGQPSKSKLTRSVRDVSIVFSVDELFINTNDHHDSLFFLFNEH